MKRLHEHSAEEVFAHHRDLAVERIYETDSVQADRIQRSRRMIARMLEVMKTPDSAHTFRHIVEPGCGFADIGGYFSQGHHVTGIEANPNHALACSKRWPWMTVKPGNIEATKPMDCDLLILCETLEHLAEPMAFCQLWLPKAKYAVISCPIGGDLQGDISGGDHVWSFSESDFTDFFQVGGHEVREIERFQMGSYTVFLGWGQRKEQI